MIPEFSKTNKLHPDTVIHWTVTRKPIFSRRLLVYLFPQAITSSGILREISEEDKSALSLSHGLIRFFLRVIESVFFTIAIIFGGFGFLWAIGSSLEHPSWMSTLSYGLSALFTLKVAKDLITSYIRPSNMKYKTKRDTRSFAVLSFPLLMYGIACPAVSGFTVGIIGVRPTFVQWLAYYSDILLNGLTLGLLKPILPKLSQLEPISFSARLLSYWVEKIMAIGVIAIGLNFVKGLSGYSEDFVGTISEFKKFLASEYSISRPDLLVFAKRFEHEFSQGMRGVPLESFRRLDDWAITLDGQLVHPYGDIVFSFEELREAMKTLFPFFNALAAGLDVAEPKPEPKPPDHSWTRILKISVGFAVITALMCAATISAHRWWGRAYSDTAAWLLLALVYLRSIVLFARNRRNASFYIYLCAAKNAALYGQSSPFYFGLKASRFTIQTGQYSRFKLGSKVKHDDHAPKGAVTLSSAQIDVLLCGMETVWVLHSFPLASQGSLASAVYDLSRHMLIAVGKDESEELIDSITFSHWLEREMRKCSRVIFMWCDQGKPSRPDQISEVPLSFGRALETGKPWMHHTYSSRANASQGKK